MKKKHVLALTLVVAVPLLCGLILAGDHEKGKTCLSAMAKDIVDGLFPSATIEKVEVEEEEIKFVEVDLTQAGKECSVNVTKDGILLSFETEVSAEDLPPAVAQAIEEAGGEIKKIEKEEIRAVVQLIELPEPVTVYEAKFIKDGKEYEIEIAADGEVLSVEAEDDDDDDDD